MLYLLFITTIGDFNIIFIITITITITITTVITVILTTLMTILGGKGSPDAAGLGSTTYVGGHPVIILSQP